jgi:heterodisulfide reductase subunit A
MSNQSSVLIYGTNLGGYRAAYALCKAGHEVIFLNPGSYVDEIKNQVLAQLPLDFCWICGHMPQRLFKALGCLKDNYNARILDVKGEAGNFKVKFSKKDQVVNNFACTECDRCIEVCPVTVLDRKAISVNPEAGWENIYVVDFENCTKCLKCEEVCPTGALKIERPEETVEAEVGAIILAPEFTEPAKESLADFGLGASPRVTTNASVAGKCLLTNFVRDAVALPSGEIPGRFGIVITPQFNEPGREYENFNLSITAVYRAVKLREILPDSEVTVYLRNYKGIGKGQYRWFRKALAAGVRFVRTDELSVSTQGEDPPKIKYPEGEDTVDLLILVTGQAPPAQMEELGKLCGIQADENGFCRIRENSTTETDVPGVFAVGEFSGPKGNPETVWDGCAALTECLGYLGEKNFKPSPPPELRDVSGTKPEVGVFICSCFGEFQKKMDLEALRESVAGLPGVSHAEIVEGCCTPPTMKATAERIKESGVNRVVLAVCTPLQKLLKYRKTVMMAGLNPLLSDYVRLREDVIQVHDDPEKMHRKALSLIRSGVERARRGAQGKPMPSPFANKALVIGGGLAGLTCAKEIASKGISVSLVENNDELGGRQAFLTRDQRDYVKTLVQQVQEDSNITVHLSSELESVEGYAGNFQARIRTGNGEETFEAGVIILATGADIRVPEGFLFDEDDRVMTQDQLVESMEGGSVPDTVAMIQCRGPEDEEQPYCSRVCCNQALSNAVDLAGRGSEVTVFYRDLASYGKTDWEARARESGVHLIRFSDSSSPEVQAKDGGLTVSVTGSKDVKVDAVVLCGHIVPDREKNERLSRILGYPLDEDGFFDSDASQYPFEEAIKKLTKPFELASGGIFPVGLAHSPRSFDEVLLTARDIAGRALVLLSKGKWPPPNAMYVADVKESLCVGCGLCVDICPYGARFVDPGTKVATVRHFLCDSCGSCVAICPSNASYLRDFKGNQSIAALDAVLDFGEKR